MSINDPAHPVQPKRGYSSQRSLWTWRRLRSRMVLLVGVTCLGLLILSKAAKMSNAPRMLGVRAGKLTECPESPNCVSSQTQSESHRLPAIEFSGSKAEAIEKIKQSVADNFSSAKLVEEHDGYLRYEFTSLIFRFVDDVEFLVDNGQQQIHFRSAARIGHSDLGVNRRRMNKISEELAK